jgi:NAD(P)-dependent dehydrogenase (short-subunit alcohol dehydrogenase family)
MGIPSIFDLTGKKAVVTGAGNGIGRRLAEALSQLGVLVAIVDLDLSSAEHTAKLIAEQGGSCWPFKADVSKVKDVENVMQKIKRTFEHIDILINCAGIVLGGSAIEFTEADWDKVIDTNLKGCFFCSQAAGKMMISKGGGKIINIASQMGIVGFPERAAYCASKGGVIQLTKALAVEWAPYNINVNAIAPTFTITSENKNMKAREFFDPIFQAEFIKTIPLRRAGRSDDLIGAAVYLSSKASEWEMDSIAAVVVGGASLAGGIGTAPNSVIGALIMGFIRNILNILGSGQASPGGSTTFL